MPIRSYEKADKEKILSLILEAQNPLAAENTRKYWEWRFENNPFVGAEGPHILILEEDNKVLGALLSFPLPLKILDQVVTIHCMTDFIVHPDSRGGGIGLAQKMSGLPEYFFGLPNKESYQLWKMLGATDLCEMESMVKVVNMNYFLRSRDFGCIVSTVAGWLWVGVDRVLFHRKLKPKMTSIAIKEIEEFDQSYDSLWEEVQKGYPITIVKNSLYLNWRYKKIGKEYKVYAATEGGKTLGFFVVRMCDLKEKAGYIVDMMVRNGDDETAQLLLARAITDMKEKGVISIHSQITSKSEFYKNIFKKNGFLCSSSTGKVVGNPHFSNTINCNDLKQDNWVLTKGDGELDLLPNG